MVPTELALHQEKMNIHAFYPNWLGSEGTPIILPVTVAASGLHWCDCHHHLHPPSFVHEWPNPFETAVHSLLNCASGTNAQFLKMHQCLLSIVCIKGRQSKAPEGAKRMSASLKIIQSPYGYRHAQPKHPTFLPLSAWNQSFPFNSLNMSSPENFLLLFSSPLLSFFRIHLSLAISLAALSMPEVGSLPNVCILLFIPPTLTNWLISTSVTDISYPPLHSITFSHPCLYHEPHWIMSLRAVITLSSPAYTSSSTFTFSLHLPSSSIYFLRYSILSTSLQHFISSLLCPSVKRGPLAYWSHLISILFTHTKAVPLQFS